MTTMRLRLPPPLPDGITLEWTHTWLQRPGTTIWVARCPRCGTDIAWAAFQPIGTAAVSHYCAGPR